MSTTLRYKATVEFDVPADKPLEVQEKLDQLAKIGKVDGFKAKSVKDEE